MIEDERITQFLQQVLFETPQHGGRLGLACERGNRILIDAEQHVVRILPGEELQQQFVQVEPAHQSQPLQLRNSPLPFCFMQRAQFGFAGPGQQQRLKRHHQTSQDGFRPACAASDQPHASEIPGKSFHNQAGFPKRVGVQYERRLRIPPLLVARHTGRAGVIRNQGSSVIWGCPPSRS